VALDLAVPHADFESDEADLARLIGEVEAATVPGSEVRRQEAGAATSNYVLL
jgi:hypothetical protein